MASQIRLVEANLSLLTILSYLCGRYHVISSAGLRLAYTLNVGTLALRAGAYCSHGSIGSGILLADGLLERERTIIGTGIDSLRRREPQFQVFRG